MNATVRRAALLAPLVLGLAIAWAAAPAVARASGPDAIRNLAGCQANTLARNDDDSTGLVSLGFSLKFYGASQSALYVNNNGNVTFDSADWQYTPYPLAEAVQPIIAPFFGDVDTRPAASGVVTYGRTTVNGRDAFCVDWSGVAGVGYYGQNTDKLNKFQLVLIEHSDDAPGDFDIEMNYDQIQWETGDASGGDNGSGGDSARVGFSGGHPDEFFEDARSGIDGTLLDSNLLLGLIRRSHNTEQLGRYIYSFHNGALLSGPRTRPKLIFVAGIGGNEIRKSDCTFLCAVWPQVLAAARYGSDLEVEADGETPEHATEGGEVFDSVFGSKVYADALNEFRGWACEFGQPCDRILRDFDTFKYDWRIGERLEGRRFADRLETECGRGPVWLVVHSTGGLILKSAFHVLRDRGIAPKTCLDGGGVFFVATPHMGAPKAVGVLANAYNFFGAKQRESVGSDTLDVLTRDLNNWLTGWQLMPRANTESELEDFPWYLKPPAGKRPREDWFGAGRRNRHGDLLNFALDAKAEARLDYYRPLGPTIGQVQYYDIFGYGGITAGSYGAETCNVVAGVPQWKPSATDARVDGVIWGDTTVPTWSASWPGQLLDSKHLYAIPNVHHGDIPGDPFVLALIKRVITSAPDLYPDWHYAHGDDAEAFAHPATRPQYRRATWCSPVAGRAVIGGEQTGVGDDGKVYEEIPNSLVDIEGPYDDPQTSVFVLAGQDDPLPVFDTTATGSGPVGFIYTDEDEVDHPFAFDVEPGDTSRFSEHDGLWQLLVDRGGDGSTDQTVELGAPSVDFTADSPLIQGHSETLTARLRGDVPSGAVTYAWSLVGAAASLVPNGSTAALKATHAPGPVTVTLKVTSANGAVASYSSDVAIEFAPPYQPAGTTCAGAPGHVVLDPVRVDGNSLFKAGSTVPVKFRVCDARGNSVSDSAVVTSFTGVTETPVSTNGDTAFRWDAVAQQWIFNLTTRGLSAGTTYRYFIELNDGSDIGFSFGLR